MSKLQPKWADKDHLATPGNIMKLEFSNAHDWNRSFERALPVRRTRKPRAITRGRVLWLMKNGIQCIGWEVGNGKG